MVRKTYSELPMKLGLLGGAPWVMQLMYSAEFLPAIDVFRWQVLGDIIKVVSWPLGFVLLAAGASKTFFITDFLSIGLFVIITWLLIQFMGVAGAGVAFAIMYVLYLPMVYILTKRRTGFRWDMHVKLRFLQIITLAILIIITSYFSIILSLLFSIIIVIYLIYIATTVLIVKSKVSGKFFDYIKRGKAL